MTKEQITNLATDELLDLKELHEITLSRCSLDCVDQLQDISIELAMIDRELNKRVH